MANQITTDEILDSRDIIDRKDELLADYVPMYNEKMKTLNQEFEELDEIDAGESEEFIQWLKDWSDNDEDGQELIALLELCEECEGYSDWSYGETLIREDYFTEYAEQLVTDCGYISKDFPSFIAIDWEETADNLKIDYMEVSLMGETYLMRCC